MRMFQKPAAPVSLRTLVDEMADEERELQAEASEEILLFVSDRLSCGCCECCGCTCDYGEELEAAREYEETFREGYSEWDSSPASERAMEDDTAYREWKSREDEPPLNHPVLYGEGTWEPWEKPKPLPVDRGIERERDLMFAEEQRREKSLGRVYDGC